MTAVRAYFYPGCIAFEGFIIEPAIVHFAGPHTSNHVRHPAILFCFHERVAYGMNPTHVDDNCMAAFLTILRAVRHFTNRDLSHEHSHWRSSTYVIHPVSLIKEMLAGRKWL